MMLKPNEIAEATIASGEAKAKQAPLITMLLGIAAGIFIGLGGVASYVMYATTADPGLGKFLGGTVFTIAIIFVIIAGGELYTGNNLMTMGWAKKKYGIDKVAINWTAVLIGNFIGSVFIAFLAAQSGLLGSIGAVNHVGEKAIIIAEAKVQLPFMQALIRGILCNMLVAGAIWMQTAAKDATGKIFLLFFPIVAFVISGYEHVVANMFYIPMGILLGADVSWSSMLVNNLVPVAIGNAIGGGLILPALYYMIYVAPKKA
ncbi:MAG: formate/nitrite transporter family protein [Acidaminobacteraceae bacterium]